MSMFMFPQNEIHMFGYLNLDLCAREALRRGAIPRAKRSVLLNPAVCAKMIADLHAEHGITDSYGGWLEDRSTLWKGSYMEADKRYIHVGVDFNVPAHTPVLLTFAAEVLRVDDDHPEEHGWGARIFFLMKEHPDIVMIFAHLAHISVGVGKQLSRGRHVATVGPSGTNGGWLPHLHVQAMTRKAYERHFQEGFKNLDGYVSRRQLKSALREFRDPLPYLLPFSA